MALPGIDNNVIISFNKPFFDTGRPLIDNYNNSRINNMFYRQFLKHGK